jgi:hypothetical protein
MSKVNPSQFEVPPDPDVIAEIEQKDAPIDKLVSEAVKFIDGSEEQDLAVERYFTEKGYSDAMVGWLVREANTRRAQGSLER